MGRKILIIGKGLIGLKHGQILQDNFQSEVKFFRRRKSDANDIDQWKEVLKFNPDFIVLASPTNLHIEQAIKFAELGKPLFIEKPLTNNLEGFEKLLDEVSNRNIPTYVAYVLRFHPGIQYLKEEVEENKAAYVKVNLANNLDCWNRSENSKNTYSAYFEQGGGVLMDMSHEIDYLHYIFGDLDYKIVQFEKYGDVTVDAPDTFHAIISNDLGINGHVYLDYYSHKPERSIQINFENYSLFLDLKSMKVDRYEDRMLKDSISFDMSFSDLYFKQMEYFIENMTSTKMMNSIFEAETISRKLYYLNQQFK